MMFDRFVGVPWVDKGRDVTGADCWGLLRLVIRELRGVELPSYSDRYVTAVDRRALDALIGGEMTPWQEIPAGDERALDAVLMREGRFLRHVGLVVEPGRLLHVSQGSTSVIERYRGGLLKMRVVGFFRYRDGP
jgi:cell wall-associated NlpC family hydrolase